MTSPTRSVSLSLKSRSTFDSVVFAFLMLFAVSSAFSIALTQIGYFTALILWVGWMVHHRRMQWPRTPLDLFFLGYAGAEILATVFSAYPLYSLNYLQRRLLLLPIVYILAAHIRSMNDAKVLFAALVGSAVGVALYSLIPLFEHLSAFLQFTTRLGEFQIYMTAGGIQMVATLLLVAVVTHRETPRKVRIVVALCMIPVLINLYFTFTRSAWLGMIVGIVIIAVYRSPRLLLGLLLLVAVAYFSATPEIREARFHALVDPHHPYNLTRLQMWRTGWRCFLDHPIIGIGDIGSETIWDKYAEPGYGVEGHLHNNVVMWAVTLGLIGVAALVALFVKAWLTVARVYKKVRGDWFGGSVALGTLAVMAGFHVAGLFEWNFGDAEIIMLIWACLGLSLGVGGVTERAERVSVAAPQHS